MKLLVAEDEKDVRELIEIILRHHGFEVISVSDGREAIAAASQQQFDLILLDVRMPRLDGYEACRRLRQMESTRNVPIIMLSALGQESEKAEGLEAGADEYVVKPFTPVSLVHVVNRYLSRNE
jgi:DNA-binding response OmpR family regulator